MKKIRFAYSEGSRISGYRCSEPHDNSGEYYRAEDVERMMDADRWTPKMVAAYTSNIVHGNPPNVLEATFQAALEEE